MGDMMSFLYIALGGAIGAVGRYSISLIPVKTECPVLTLITNLIGAVLIGFIVGLADNRTDVSQNTTLFLKTGVCGGFTTFSTFSLEAYSLIEKKLYFAGISYILLSVILCIVGVFLGKKLSMIFS